MKFLSNKFGFTFVELIVAMFISSIVLTSVFFFIAQNVDEITSSTNRTTFYNKFYEFRDKFLYFSNIYSSGIVLVDNSSTTGNDILLFQNSTGTDGVILGVIDQNINRLEQTESSYDTYYDKSLGYRRLSESEISSIKSNSGTIYDIVFYRSNIYDELNVRDLQAELYNSGTILNIDISLIQDYNESFVGIDWNNLKGQGFFKFNLNF